MDALQQKLDCLYAELDEMCDALDRGYRLHDPSEPSRIKAQIDMLEEIQKENK